jgi:hypothetical protein
MKFQRQPECEDAIDTGIRARRFLSGSIPVREPDGAEPSWCLHVRYYGRSGDPRAVICKGEYDAPNRCDALAGKMGRACMSC